MSGMFKPKIEEPEKVVEPVRITEKVVRFQTADQHAQRTKPKPVGRNGFVIDRARPQVPGGGLAGLNLPRI